MTMEPHQKALIEQLCNCLYLTDLRAFDEAMTRIGATIPGKQKDFYHNGNHCDINEVVKNLLQGEDVSFGPLVLRMSEDLNDVMVEELPHASKSYREDLISGFHELVLPMIKSTCAMVIQTARNFEKPFDYL